MIDADLLIDPLHPETERTLLRLDGGCPPRLLDRFEIAYLIARGCLDFDGQDLKLTNKGQRLLDVLRKEER